MLKTPKSQSLKFIVIVGPTASGKSNLGVQIALRLAQGGPDKIGGEIISVDSRQVYRGMDIGSGKITKKEMLGVPHHLLDVVSPRSEFSVSHFKKLAARKIEEVISRSHMPIIVGGTGFWIDALIYDWPLPEIGPNLALRLQLDKLTVEKLFAKLKKLDPVRAATIDRHNPRRLIRALEIVMAIGRPTPEFKISYKSGGTSTRYKIGGKEYRVLILGIKLSRQELEHRIYKRLIGRLKVGMVEEIKKLHKSGVSWKQLDNFGLEYRYVSRYLRGLLTYDQMIEQLYLAIKNYAKRQRRWFKRNPQIKWIRESGQAIKLARKFIV